MSARDLPDGYAVASEAWAAGFNRPPRQTVSEWADEHRRLPAKGASEPGQWRTKRVPFIREVMDCLSPFNPVRKVVFCKSTQVAGTESGLNWIGYVIDRASAPMLVVQPTVEIGELFSKQRLQPMIDESPRLRGIIGPARSRDSGNTTLVKEFPGGLLRITGSNSAAGLRSMPAKYLFLDEVDAYEHDVEGEGDPVTLAERRTSTFPRRKILLVSTPTIKGVSRIDREYEASDQRRYHVPCPHCGEKQHLKWPNLRWDDELTRVWYVCEHNGCMIEEHHKTRMLEGGVWIATYPDREVAGFHINALYTPIGLGDSWLDHAKRWLAAQGDPALLKSFVNTILGEAWEDRSSQIKPHELLARAEPYRLRTVPVGCLILTAGIDVQDDRFAVQVVGWGRGERCWVIDWFELPADTSREDEWERLDSLLLAQTYRNQFGVDMRIVASAVDTGGHQTHQAYNWVRLRKHRGVFAVKGSSVANKPVVNRPTKQDINWRGKVVKDGVELYSVGVDTAKSVLMARLLGDGKVDVTQRLIHFSHELPEDYYKQLTAEVFDPTKNRWVKRRGQLRNEALDTWVYAYFAALQPSVRLHMLREADWQKLESVIEPKTGDLFAAPPDPPPRDEPLKPLIEPPQTPATSGRSALQRPRKGGFATNWRK